MTNEDLVWPERVAVGAACRRVGEPLPRRRQNISRMTTCSHCSHPEVSPDDAHARYRPEDKSLPKRCRWCRFCDNEYPSHQSTSSRHWLGPPPHVMTGPRELRTR